MNGRASHKKRPWIAKVGLAVGSAACAYLLVLVVGRACVWQMGIRDRDFRYENAIQMWREEPQLGFANKRNFSDYCFGTVHVATNAQGFRGQAQTPSAKTPGRKRIIGIGDSVMWGTSVDESESILGRLQAKLAESRQVEVVNAAVVGYSTLQESLLLTRLLHDYSPDLVLVNFCENDLLPTEDPFGSVRRVYLDQIQRYLIASGSTLSPVEQSAIAELIQVFESPAPVHATMSRISPACGLMAMRLFLEIPITRMAEEAKANQTQLIYLLIPPRDDQQVYLHLAQFVKRLLLENQVDYLDLGPALEGDRSSHSNGIAPAEPSASWLTWLESKALPDLQAIKLVRQTNAIHGEQKYIDHVHPSKQGNEIIAQQIFEYLSAEEGLAPTSQ